MTSNGSATYTYDAENRLVTTGGVTYAYDGSGKRVKKSNGTLYWSGMSSDALTETDSSGTPTADYVFFNGKRIARVDLPGGAVHYYFSDHLGSASVITSNAGAIQSESDYYPYGGERSVTSGDTNRYKFTGKERDIESTLDQMGDRYYSSQLGRFQTVDWSAGPAAVPYADLANPQTLNLYAYVKNNPLNLTDPNGHLGTGMIGSSEGAFIAPRMRPGDSLYSSAEAVVPGVWQVIGADGETHFVLGSEADAAAAAQDRSAPQTASSTSDKRTDIMLTANSVPPKPSVTEGAQFEMDYRIVPQANTMQQLQDNASNLRNDPATQGKYSKMEVSLWESQRGGKWQWQGDRLKGHGHDVLNVFARSADQRWYIDGKRVQLVIGKDSGGRLIKAWTVHVEITPSGLRFSKGD